MADNLNTTNPSRDTPAQIVFDMDDDLGRVERYAEQVYLLGTGIAEANTEAGSAVQQTGADLIDTMRRLREDYDRLFHAMRSAEAEATEPRGNFTPIESFEARRSPIFKTVVDMQHPSRRSIITPKCCFGSPTTW